MRKKIFSIKERFQYLGDNEGLIIIKNEEGLVDGLYNVTSNSYELILDLSNATNDFINDTIGGYVIMSFSQNAIELGKTLLEWNNFFNTTIFNDFKIENNIVTLYSLERKCEFSNNQFMNNTRLLSFKSNIKFRAADNVFLSCSNLINVYLKNTIQFGANMFNYCSSIKNIYAPDCISIGLTDAYNSMFVSMNTTSSFEVVVNGILKNNYNNDLDGDLQYILTTYPKGNISFENILPNKVLLDYSWSTIGDSISWYDSHRTYDVVRGYQSFVKDEIKFSSLTDTSWNGGGAIDFALHPTTVPFVVADVYSVMLGINDFRKSVLIGTIDDYIDNTGTGTFYGCLRIIIDNIRVKKSTAKIFLITPLKAYDFFDVLPNTPYDPFLGNSLNPVATNLYIEDYVDAIKNIINYTDNTYLIDAYYNTEFNLENMESNMIDIALHPNEIGNKILGKIIAKRFKEVINKVGINDIAPEANHDVTLNNANLIKSAVGGVAGRYKGDGSQLRLMLENTSPNETSFRIGHNATIIQKNADNSHTPATVTFNLYKTTRYNAEANYSGKFLIETSNNNVSYTTAYETATSITDVDTVENTKVFTIPANTVKIRIKAYSVVGKTLLLDTQYIDIVPYDSTLITAHLKNDNHILPCNYNGKVVFYSGSNNEISVYDGITKLTCDDIGTANGTYKVVASSTTITPGTASISNGNYIISKAKKIVSSILSGTATISFLITGTKTDGTPFELTKYQSFTKNNISVVGGKQTALIFFSDNDLFIVGTDFYKNNSDEFYIFDGKSAVLPFYTQFGNVSIGYGNILNSYKPKAKLDVNGGLKLGTDSDAASLRKVGTFRHTVVNNKSKYEVCTQTSTGNYAWIELIKKDNPLYESNALALAGGLLAGDYYHNSVGQVFVVV